MEYVEVVEPLLLSKMPARKSNTRLHARLAGETQCTLLNRFHEADETSPKHKNELLDEGLEESFPASDPPAISITRIVKDVEGC